MPVPPAAHVLVTVFNPLALSHSPSSLAGSPSSGSLGDTLSQGSHICCEGFATFWSFRFLPGPRELLLPFLVLDVLLGIASSY